MRKSRRETIFYLLHLYISIIFFLIIVSLHKQFIHRTVHQMFIGFLHAALFLKGANGCSKQTVLNVPKYTSDLSSDVLCFLFLSFSFFCVYRL